MAYERVTLYGVPLVARRRVGYAGVEPDVARELFIRHALVEGDWETRHHFFRDNQALLAELAEIEERARRRDLLVGDDELFAFYDAADPRRRRQRAALRRLVEEAAAQDAGPADAHPRRRCCARRRRRRREPGGLAGRRSRAAAELPLRPGRRRRRRHRARARRRAGAPGRSRVQLAGAGAARGAGHRARSARCPRTCAATSSRRPTPPAPCWPSSDPGQEPLLEGLQRELHRRTGVLVPLERSTSTSCRPTCGSRSRSRTPRGEVVARGKDLAALQEELAAPVRAAVAAAVARRARTRRAARLAGRPRRAAAVGRAHQRRAHRARLPGVRRRRKCRLDKGVRLRRRADGRDAPRHAAAAAADHAVAGQGRRAHARDPGPAGARRPTRTARSRRCSTIVPTPRSTRSCRALPWTRADVRRPCSPTVRADLVARVGRHRATGSSACSRPRTRCAARCRRQPPASQAEAIDDIRAQFGRLLPPGFVTRAGRDRLPDLARYLDRRRAPTRAAAARRRDRPRPHAARARGDRGLRRAGRRAAGRPGRGRRTSPRSRWQLEELRVSLWAQQLGTPRPVSEQRIYRAIDAITP